MRFNYLLFFVFTTVLGLQDLSAQTFISRFQEVRIGFYSGQANYLGDFNPRFLGTSLELEDGYVLRDEQRTGQNNFGAWLKLPINDFFSARANMGFGTLTYTEPRVNFNMSTSYSDYGMAIEMSLNPGGYFIPYLGIGASLISWNLPPPVTNIELRQYTTGVFNEKRRAANIPAFAGIQYFVSDRASVFGEVSLNMVLSDDLDNLSAPQSLTEKRFGGDAIVNFRFGLNVSIVKVFEMFRNRRAVPKPNYVDPPLAQKLDVSGDPLTPFSLLSPDSLNSMFAVFLNDSLAQVRQDSIMQARQQEEMDRVMAELRAEEEALRLKREAELKKQQEADKFDPSKPVTDQRIVPRSNLGRVNPETGEPTKIPIAKPEDREFSEEDELARIRELTEIRRQQYEQAGQEMPARDRFLPVIMILPKPISSDIIVDGFVTSNPPAGYYVQVYATVGPITAQRNRQRTMDILRDVLENVEQQVIITKRRQFYEVRIGVFDSYDDTIEVLERVAGTYVDAYSLIYLQPTE